MIFVTHKHIKEINDTIGRLTKRLIILEADIWNLRNPRASALEPTKINPKPARKDKKKSKIKYPSALNKNAPADGVGLSEAIMDAMKSSNRPMGIEEVQYLVAKSGKCKIPLIKYASVNCTLSSLYLAGVLTRPEAGVYQWRKAA